MLAIIILVLSVTFIQAQPTGGQQGRDQGPPPVPNDKQIEKMLTDLSKELSLSEEQEKQISDLYFTHFEEMGEMQEANKNSRPDREVMEKMKDDFESGVKSYLTKDQKKSYNAYLRKQESQRGGQGKPQR